MGTSAIDDSGTSTDDGTTDYYTGIADGVVSMVDDANNGGDFSSSVANDPTATTASVGADGDVAGGISLIGFNGGTPLPAGSVLRITVGISFFNSITMLSSTWLKAAQQFYNTINLASCGCIPIAPFAGATGDEVTVIDVNVHSALATAATAVNNLHNLCPTLCDIKSVELLSPADRALALQPVAGANARAVVKASVEKNIAASNPVTAIIDRFESLAGVTKWVAVAIVVGGILYFTWPFLRKRE